jgi:hypothetical protein
MNETTFIEQEGTEMSDLGTAYTRYLKRMGWTALPDNSFVIVDDGWNYMLTYDEDGLFTLTNTDLQDVYECSYDLYEMMEDFMHSK